MRDGSATGHAAGDAIFLTGATGFLGMELWPATWSAPTATSTPWSAPPTMPARQSASRGDRGAVRRSRRLRVAAGRRSPAMPRRRGWGSNPRGGARSPPTSARSSTAPRRCPSPCPCEDSRRVNVAGTRRLLEFAELCRERGGLRKFAYVSTAYVAGDHAGLFREDELDVGQGFRNSYERSKFEAERLVREHTDRLPVQIFRPSIIVGEQSSGWTASFNVLYPPLRGFAAGCLSGASRAPGYPGGRRPGRLCRRCDLRARPAARRARRGSPPGRREAGDDRRPPRRARRALLQAPPAAPGAAAALPAPDPPAAGRGKPGPAPARPAAGRDPVPLLRACGCASTTAAPGRGSSRRGSARPRAPRRYLDRLLDFAVAARWGKRRVTRAEAHR